VVAGGVGTYIYNNYISDLRAPSSNLADAIRGINITHTTASSTIGLYYNTIYLNASSSGTNFGTTGVYHTYSTTATTATLDMRNNIIANNSTPKGTGITVAFRRSAATNLNNYGSASNNNIYYAGATEDATHAIFYNGTVYTMAGFKTLAAPKDAASSRELPPFTDVSATPYNLHLSAATATQCESGGTTVSTPVNITVDWDADARYPNPGYPTTTANPASNPDVGADEFAGIPLDITPPMITYVPIANQCSSATMILTATITDASGVPTTGTGLPQLFYKVNAGSYTNIQGVSIGSNQYTFTFTPSIVIGDSVSYYVVAQDNILPPNLSANPSAGAAGFTPNPPACSTPPTTPNKYKMIPTLASTISIPMDYATIEAAIAALNSSCIPSGGVTFNVAAGHAETLSGPLAGLITASGTASDPIIFQKSGTGSNPLIIASGLGTIAPTTTIGSNGDGVIILSGGDYITFDGIDIQENASASTGTLKSEYGFLLKKASGTDACKNVTIRNCNITLDKTVIYSFGIFVSNFSGSTAVTVTSTGGRSENIRIYNNTISNVYGGIILTGFNAPTPFDFYDQNIEIGKDGANTINDFAGGATGAMGIYTVYQNNLKIINNVLTSAVGNTGTLYGMYTTTSTNSNLEISGNTITLTSGGTSSSMYGISNSMGSSGTNNTVDISNNVVEYCTYTTATSASFYGINTTASAFNLNVHGNLIRNNTLGSGSATATGNFYGILSSGTNTNTGSLWKLYGNEVYGNSRMQSILGAGPSYGIHNSSSGLTVSIYSNNVYSNSWPSTSSAYGIYLSSSAPDSLLVETNEVHDITKPNAVSMTTLKSGALYGIYISNTKANAKTHIRSNNVYNLTNSWGGQAMGYRGDAGTTGTVNVYSNTAYNISSDDQAIFGIYNGAGLTNNIYNNRLYNLNAAVGDSACFYGISTGSTTAASVTSVYNNYVSDLKTLQADVYLSAALYMFGSTAGTTHQYYNNTVYLNNLPNAGNPVTAAVFAGTVPNLDMRNNILVNNSTVFGTGATISFWREDASAATYLAGSNHNCFHAGTPGVNNLIYYDGTNVALTITEYQALFPQESQSFTELPPFTDITTAPYDLHLLTNVATSCESYATVISSPAITTDYDGQARFPNPGYPDNPSYPATAPDVGADEFGGIPNFTCTTPVPGNTLTSANGICLGSSVALSMQNPTPGTGVTYQWQRSPDDVTYSDISGAVYMGYTAIPTVPTYYKCKVTCQNGPSSAYSNSLQITFANAITSTTPGTRCGTGTVSLAAAAGSGTIQWYAAPVGGAAIGTGSPFTTPVISSSTDYYVSASTPGSAVAVGPLDPTIGSSATADYIMYYMVFDVHASQATIQSVDIFPTATVGSSYNIIIQDASENQIYSSGSFTNTVTGGATAQTVTLNAVIPAGTGYRMGVTVNSGMTRNSTGAVYPYTAPGTLSITGNTFNSVYYYFFYNWQVIGMCESNRTAVTATVTTPPAVTALATPSVINSGDNSTLTASSSNDPSYTYTWTPVTSPATGATVTASPTVTTLYTVDAVDNTAGPHAGCVTSATTTVYIASAATWTGAVNTDWATSGNWTGGVPDPGTSATIPSAPVNQPIVNQAPASPAVCNSLTIQNGASVTIAAGKALTVSGTLTNNSGNAGLVINSDATGTGSLIFNTTGVSGTVQRYVAAWGDYTQGWHLLASPVTAQAFQPTFVSNPPSSSEDFYLWDETQALWINSKPETSPPYTFSTAFGTDFVVGKGYLVAYQSNGAKTFMGTMNVADAGVNGLTYTSGAPYTGGITPGWNLLGNPFTSPVTWNTAGWALSNVGAVAKIWKDASVSYVDITAGDIIPAMQGFMVEVGGGGGGGGLTIPAAARAHSAQPWYKSSDNPYIKLVAHNLSANSAQESVVAFDPQAGPGYDMNFDSHFFPGYAPEFYSVDGSEHLSTNVLPGVDNQTTIPFNFVKSAGSKFSIEAAVLENLPGQVYLTDLKFDKTQNLSENPVYNFTSSSSDNPARFILSFNHVGIFEYIPNNNGVYSYDDILYVVKPGKAKLEVYSLAGQKLLTRDIDDPGLYKTALNVPTGYYVVRLITGTKVVITKVFIKS